MVADVHAELAPRGLERLRQSNLQARIGNQEIRLGDASVQLDTDLIEQHSVGEFGVPVQVREDGSGVAAISVLVDLQPQARQRIGTAIGVSNDLIGGELPRGRIDVRVNLVVGSVLPIVRARSAIRGAITIHRLGKRQRRERLCGIVARNARRSCTRGPGSRPHQQEERQQARTEAAHARAEVAKPSRSSGNWLPHSCRFL